MAQKVKPVPEGFHTAAPLLIVEGAARAIEFYRQAFGATEELRLTDPESGVLLHAEVRVGDSVIMLADENERWGTRSPRSLGGTPVAIHLYVEDVDVLAERAVAAGAEVLIPVADQYYGDRTGRLRDPFGHEWIVATHVEDVSPGEMQRRTDAFMRQQG